MTRLVEIADGTWVDPDSVTRVVAYCGSPEKRGYGRVIAPEVLPFVVVKFHDSQLRWSFDTIEAANDAADRVAGIINGASDDPDDPDREDIPVEEPDNVLVLRGRVAA